MPIERTKVQVWWLFLGVTLLLTGGLVVGLGKLVVYLSTGADPATALNSLPVAPPDLAERLHWLPDRPLSPLQRVMEPTTREQITDSYLRAWAQWAIAYEVGQPYGLKTYFSGPALAGVTQQVTTTVAAGWQLLQSNVHHELELHFYADDGSIVAFTDRNLQLVQNFRNHTTGESYLLESSHRYDVVMLLQDGNWRIYQWQRRGDAAPVATKSWIDPAAPMPTHPAQPLAGMATIRGNQLWVDGAPYTVAGVNYYPQRSPWTKFWPEYDPAQTSADLQLIRLLKLNTVRIFLSYADLGGAQVLPEMRAKLADFLARADQAGLKVIVTLFDHHTDHHPATWAADARHLATLLPYFADNPTILAWDIKNEPDRDYEYNTQALGDGWLRFVARHVRGHDPNHLLTIGWSNPEAAASLADVVDFVAFHYFDEPATYTQRFKQLQAAVGDKPLLLEEFTFSTWNSPFFPGHTEAEQARYYTAILQQQRTLQSPGYLVWTLHDFDVVPLAEFRYPWQRGAQAHMGLFRRDGRAKAAASLVAPKAALSAPTPPKWAYIVKPFWLTLLTYTLLLLSIIGWYGWRKRHRRR
ncbi:MAG: cellulase family glycosylhydrolase [Caldilineaceae bacterium]